MAGRWNQFGFYGAQGLAGKDALSQQLQELVRAGGIKSPVDSPRGLAARLRYLDSPRGREALREAGIKARPSVVKAWREGNRQPRAATLDRIQHAYLEHRAANLVRSGALARHLDNNGRGTRVEIYPVDQRHVREGRKRDIPQRSITVRYVWEDMVNAWAAGDEGTLDEIWDDIICDLDSEYDAYTYVSAVGFA
ncbi:MULTISPECIES: hypothetical protein [Streptomyces]|uniref:hypothetical protein n=1 Tax=Streptomyces TaxID=1883 RepID=UPI00163CD758|nr:MULTISPECIES: hypothetical protein [Streptomyces]MBC2879815.1 hypothetical protein [Streptomyces sp. TYQ1024]UBI41421.1 hypothetical protein K7I03_33695 [Streptomyces mobaraensis]